MDGARDHVNYKGGTKKLVMKTINKIRNGSLIFACTCAIKIKLCWIIVVVFPQGACGLSNHGVCPVTQWGMLRQENTNAIEDTRMLTQTGRGSPQESLSERCFEVGVGWW